ncbi:hypothetical protein [Psychromonas sp. SP041]|uniref:hypothetical protein n=1 Tax=Psychromonas sp. SP041 TaxID=1365007 RepID=UPI0010C7864C|nr:hypothetical protein [Psychromonas sp. SP041]
MSVCLPAKFSYRNSLEWVTAFITCLLVLGVIQTFIIGRHFIIPTAILAFVILLGNLTTYAFMGRLWAKKIVFWLYLIFTSHLFFALFWAKKYREILEQAFVPSFTITFILFAFLLIQYNRKNRLFIRSK